MVDVTLATAPTQEKDMEKDTGKDAEKEEKGPGIFARLISWVASHVDGKGAPDVTINEEVSRLGKDFISRTLPHRGRWLLLDAVEVTAHKVTGFFTVTKELCEGHGIGENTVLPGVLLLEMANQLVGVWYATQHPELIGTGVKFFARDGAYKSNLFVLPGELLCVEVNFSDLNGEMKTNRRGIFVTLTGRNFVFKVGKVQKGEVRLVELKNVEPPKIAPIKIEQEKKGSVEPAKTDSET